MARIPQILSDPARGGLPPSSAPTYASPAAFGAGIADTEAQGAQEIGAATRQLGGAMIGTGVSIGDYFQAQDALNKKSQIANVKANADFTQQYIDLQKQPPPDGMTYPEVVGQKYDEFVQNTIDPIKDDTVRSQVKMDLMAKKEQYVSSAAVYQQREAKAVDKQLADTGSTLQYNRVATDPSIDTYNDALTKVNDVIDARPNLSPAEKEVAKAANASKLGQRRFEGMIRNAETDPDALGAIENELTAPNSVWKGRLTDEAYKETLDKIVTLRHAANSQETATARAALGSVKERNEKGELIDPTELSAVQAAVGASKNPALLSEYAMVAKAQDIYRNNRGLPLDQQRAKIQEMRNKPGITGLPQPVQDGITQGSALTGGQISTEFLAGLAGVEYGQHMNSGDYGKGPDNGASDAAGVAQFTKDTFHGTARAHADELGIPANATDAQLDEMRKDPVMAMKAAALHALDNKHTLESALGRPVNEADLYFAHLLGTGGGTRFLAAAQQTPGALATSSVDKAQVDANRSIFYDGDKPLQNWQVRSKVANLLMNNLSRVDYAGVKAATLTYNNTVTKLKDDPITFAQDLGRFGPVGDISSADGVARRGVVAQQIAEYYSIPSADIKPFTKDEAEALAKKARDGTADDTLAVMSQVRALGTPEIVKAGNQQIGEKDSLFGYAASLAYGAPDKAGVAADIIRGEKRMKLDKDVVAAIGQNDTDLQATFAGIVGKALADTNQGTTIRKAAMAYYVERQLSRGAAQPGRFDKDAFADSVHAVLGADPGKLAVDNVNGAPTKLPYGVDSATFNGALRNMADTDYVANSKWGGPPRYADGTPVTAQEIATNGKFEALDAKGTEYRIKMGDGKYALSGAYKDGSADFYIFRADPDRLRQYSTRQSVTVPLKPMVPGVQPAQPRVVQ